MLHTIFIKCKVDVMYFIFIFISPSVPKFSLKKSVNQLIKNKRPNGKMQKLIKICSNGGATYIINKVIAKNNLNIVNLMQNL